ncbi:thioredoxin family protein [Companilactobacillus jidongensis]|uniref:thioredoxin family protein n=1 Tax=Companilactobacillus jidongensis TaxID=2486006 RepID=UPI0013DDE483|nr:thioredoxin family protein [Companilactobacillus jidongensis]
MNEDILELKDSSKLVLAILTTDFCTAGEICATQMILFHQLEVKLSKEINFVKINVDTNPFIEAAWHISRLPTMVLMNNKKIVYKFEGQNLDVDTIVSKLNKFIQKTMI